MQFQSKSCKPVCQHSHVERVNSPFLQCGGLFFGSTEALNGFCSTEAPNGLDDAQTY